MIYLAKSMVIFHGKLLVRTRWYIKSQQAINRCPWMSNHLLASLRYWPCIGKIKSTCQMRQGLGDESREKVPIAELYKPAETSKPDAKIFFRTTCSMTHTDMVYCFKAKSAALLTRAKWNPNHTKYCSWNLCLLRPSSPSQRYLFEHLELDIRQPSPTKPDSRFVHLGSMWHLHHKIQAVLKDPWRYHVWHHSIPNFASTGEGSVFLVREANVRADESWRVRMNAHSEIDGDAQGNNLLSFQLSRVSCQNLWILRLFNPY